MSDLDIAVSKPKYHSVNSLWPPSTNEGRDLKPTQQEAMAAAKRLYRFAMKKPFAGKVKLTSGRRYTWIRNHVLYVNPDLGGTGGWHELVHLMSHLCAQRLFPNARGHGHQHLFLEKEMIRHVVSSGWLDGKLRKAERPKLAAAEAQRENIVTRIKRWETKKKRAETALWKLRQKAARLERRLAA